MNIGNIYAVVISVTLTQGPPLTGLALIFDDAAHIETYGGYVERHFAAPSELMSLRFLGDGASTLIYEVPTANERLVIELPGFDRSMQSALENALSTQKAIYIVAGIQRGSEFDLLAKGGLVALRSVESSGRRVHADPAGFWPGEAELMSGLGIGSQ